MLLLEDEVIGVELGEDGDLPPTARGILEDQGGCTANG